MDENKEKKFISERILGREMTLRRAVRWVLVSLACGIVFGLAVFGVNYLAQSVAKKAEKKQKETVESTESFTESAPATEETLPQITGTETKDSEPETETVRKSSAETETGSGSEAKEQEEGTGEEESEAGEGENEEGLPEEDLFHEALLSEREKYPFGTEELNQVLNTQADACEEVARYIVRVSNTISEVTWFESIVESRRDYSGIIVSVEETEILILTVADAVRDNGSLSVTFHDGTRNEAVIKKESERDGLAVVAVSTEGLGSEFLADLKPVETVPTEEIRAGMSVITAGSPMGAVNSFGFGNVNYIAEPESVEDGLLRGCYSEAPSDPGSGTFLMSVDGKLLGLAAEKKENSKVSGSRFLMAESCQNLIESLKKGNDMAWLGITGIDISFDMKYKNVPEGLYVTDVNETGPAFSSGLKRGDIIVNIGAREIKGISDYLNFMRNLRPGETVSVKILREAGHSEYKEVEMAMTAGTR